MTDIEVKPLRGYSEEPIFYVYFHKRPDGSVFYVGKGKDKRAWYTRNRNTHWWNVVNKHGGFDVEIVKENLTEQEAFKLEAELVEQIGIDNLTNQTLGGISTTGYRHTKETRELQSKIGKEKLQDPHYAARLQRQMADLHYKQRYDEEYKKRMSELQKEHHASLSEEEKQEKNKRLRDWMKDEDKLAKARQAQREKAARKEHRENLSKRAKAYWESLTEEEYQEKCKLHAAILRDPRNIEKRTELHGVKIVVNRKYIFKTAKEFSKYVGAVAFNTTHMKLKMKEFGFTVRTGYFLEFFDEELHSNCVPYSGQTIQKLDFDCLPRSKAVVTDGKVFLSMQEAAAYTGLNSEVRVDFITKNLKLGKPALGFYWRVATNEEIIAEILSRLEKLNGE